MDPVTGSIIGSVGSTILGGLFGRSSAKKARRQAIEDERLKFVRLREAAELGGFNPLTGLQNGGLNGLSGLPSGGLPPLASAQMMTQALSAASDELTGVNTQKRQQQQLDMDLTKIKIEAAKAQLAAARALPVASGAVGGGAARLGRATTPGTGVLTTAAQAPGNYSFNPAPGREVERKPAENIPGYMQVENTITGKPVWVMGSDGDPWDPIQTGMVYGQSALQTAAEAFYNGAKATFGHLPLVQKATAERDAMLAGLKKRMKFGGIPQSNNVWRR